MPQLMITCPHKHKSLPTNQTLSEADFAAADHGTNTIGPCPHCGGQHTWTIADAYLAGTAPKPASASVRREPS